MSDQPHVGDHDQSEAQQASAYLRLPTPVAAAAIAVFLIALLAVGIYANSNVRPPPGAINTPVVPGVAPTATSMPVAAVLANATATTMVIVMTPTPALTVGQSPGPSPSPTLDTQLASELGQAYEHYWQIRGDALLNLDGSKLPDVADGAQLKALEDLIAQLKSEGHAIQTNVDHNYRVIDTSNDTGHVLDVYVSNSVYVDISTGGRVSEPSGDRVSELYDLKWMGGTWKVVNLASVQ